MLQYSRAGRCFVSFCCPLLLLAALLLAASPEVWAGAPLHQRIDERIAAGNPQFKVQAATLASDAEFLRRTFLDLNGTIPTINQARAFLADQSSNKRQQLIERLLTSPEYARRMASVFDVMLMERRPDQHIPRIQWQEYLRSSFAENKPLDEMVREILTADGTNPKLRPAAKFYLDRGGEPNLLTRDVGRLFLGMNLQCAQCHDHPLVDDYKQDYYYGIYAFFSRSFVFAGKNRQALVADKAEGEVTYQSVFDPAKVTRATGPRLPGESPIKEPKFAKSTEYLVAPAAGVMPVPRFSRRAQLGAQMTDPANAHFRRNMVNRLWALMMGRGLIHPLDLDSGDNPPSHPELLAFLMDQFAAMKFDVRNFLRELALSNTYQRSSEMPPGIKDVLPNSFAVANLKPLSPEQLAWSFMEATGTVEVQRLGLGKRLSEELLHKALAGNEASLVRIFASPPGQPENESFQATLEQALFIDNGSLLRGWLSPRPGDLTFRLLKERGSRALAESLYLSILTRLPTKDEEKEVVDYLQQQRGERGVAMQELAWALIASSEFRFNH